MIAVIVDYDNDSIRIMDEKDNEISVIKLSCSPDHIEDLLNKIFKALADSDDGNITFAKQDEGQVTIIDNF